MADEFEYIFRVSIDLGFSNKVGWGKHNKNCLYHDGFKLKEGNLNLNIFFASFR